MPQSFVGVCAILIFAGVMVLTMLIVQPNKPSFAQRPEFWVLLAQTGWLTALFWYTVS